MNNDSMAIVVPFTGYRKESDNIFPTVSKFKDQKVLWSFKKIKDKDIKNICEKTRNFEIPGRKTYGKRCKTLKEKNSLMHAHTLITYL